MSNLMFEVAVPAAWLLILGAGIREWVASRTRASVLVLAAVLGLGAATLAETAGDLIGVDEVMVVGSVAFMFAPVPLLALRHRIKPLARWVIPVYSFTVSVVLAIAFKLDLMTGTDFATSPVPLTLAGVGIAAWAVAVIDPLVRIWTAAQREPLITRGRMRGLAVGFAAMTVILVGILNPATPIDAYRIGTLVILAGLAVAVSPPRSLRRLWREKEERALLTGSRLFAASDPTLVARAIVEWAVRLVGARAGVLVSPSGSVGAAIGVDQADETWVAAITEGREGKVTLPGPNPVEVTAAAVVHLHLDEGTARLIVLAGDFTPALRAEEMDVLRTWAAAGTAALERLRMDEIRGAFLAAIHHEIRTPLTAVSGLARTLARPDVMAGAADRRDDLLAMIVRNADRLQRVVSDILDLDRLSRGLTKPTRADVDVESAVRQAVDATPAIAPRTVSVRVQPGLRVQADDRMMTRLLENLLSNVAKHTPEDTAVDISARSDDGWVTIAVSDDGPGVPSALRDVIFEPFRSGPDAPTHSPGTGIGLALVRQIAAAHGGKTVVADAPGGGAMFVVSLPRVGSRVQEASTPTDQTV